MALRILHTNDFHGTLTPARLERLRALREDADFYFDSGDCIKAGNLAIPVRPDAAWPALEALRCTASVLGNRETHVLRRAFDLKIAGARHPLMAANLRDRSSAYPLARSLILDSREGKVGVVAVMVPMVTARMATQAASAFLWDLPIPVAKELAETLRPQVDCLIALTHIGFTQDRKLAEICPLFDLILGGHSHTVLDRPTLVGKTAICQAGSHGRFAGLVEWSKDRGVTGFRLVSL